ncbi:hypothetical protein ACQ1ZG_14770, partial [Enterococcus faecalis]|uniref:hypothetical protein n=1 Tax=Enterococcus faecalis TaxID=1351 RepID=UPI003D6B5BCD
KKQIDTLPPFFICLLLCALDLIFLTAKYFLVYFLCSVVPFVFDMVSFGFLIFQDYYVVESLVKVLLSLLQPLFSQLLP